MGTIALFFGLALAPPVWAQESDHCTAQSLYRAEIDISGLRNGQGLVAVELYDDSPDGFIKKAGRLKRIRLDAQSDGLSLCMELPHTGRFAIAVFHDENANRKFDRSFLGLPDEGFGFSQNPKLRFGPPDFEDAAFQVDGETVRLAIEMTYW